VKLSIIYNI